MYKVFIFLLAVLLLALIGSLTVMAVFSAAGFVKDIIDDWRK